MATPLTIIHLGRVGSTQDEARRQHRSQPLLVTATAQERGRGRSGARWVDADRSLAASLAFEPGWPTSAVPRLALVAGLAITDILPAAAMLKWPNDVEVDGLKVGGILSESVEGLVVVGLGLNVYWASPPSGMGALHPVDPGDAHVRRVAERWAKTLLERVATGPDSWGREEYEARCGTIGKDITWHPDGSGRAIGVADDGSLVVRTDAGVTTIESGVVRDVRPV